MYVTLKDTKTGEVATDETRNYSLLYWSVGGGSCDCNRAIALGHTTVAELETEHGKSKCFGAKRIIVTDVHGDLEGLSKKLILKEINEDYPTNLKPK